MTKYVVNNYMTSFMPMGFEGLRHRVSQFADYYLPRIIKDAKKQYDETDGKEGRDFVHHNVLELGTNFKTAKLCEYAVDQSMVRTWRQFDVLIIQKKHVNPSHEPNFF